MSSPWVRFVSRCWRQGIGFLKLPSCTPNPSDHQSPVWVSFILFRCASISRIPVGQPVRSSSQSSQSVFSRKCLGFQKMPASLKFARVSRKCQTIQKILELFANARIFFEFVRISRKAKFTSVEPICVMKSLSGYSSLNFSVPAICSSLCSHNYITSL